LEIGGEVRGILKDEKNEPVVNAKVTVVNSDYGPDRYGQVFTDKLGWFRIPNVPRATQLEISVTVDMESCFLLR